VRIDILGVKIDSVTKNDVLEKVREFTNDENPQYIVTVNPEFVLMAQRDDEFRRIINKAGLSLADGMGIVMAGKFLSKKYKLKGKIDFPILNYIFYFLLSLFEGLKVGLAPFLRPSYLNVISERISGADLVLPICELAKKNKLKIFILGREGGLSTVERYKKALVKRFPGIRVDGIEIEVGSWNPPAGGEAGEEEVRKKIKDFEPHVVLVTLGMGYQEKWIARNKDLRTPLSIGLGSSLDYLTGGQQRAPRLLHKFGLEWLFRLWSGDTLRNRFLRVTRIFRATIIFPLKVFIYSLTNR